MRRNFEYDYDQWTFRMVLSKKLPNSDGSRSHPISPLVLNKTTKMNTQNTIASSYHSKFRSTLNFEITLSSSLGYGVSYYIFICELKAKFSLITLTWQTQLTFDGCMETLYELYVFLTGFMLSTLLISLSYSRVKLYGKTRVTSYEFRVASYKLWET